MQYIKTHLPKFVKSVFWFAVIKYNTICLF